MERTMRAGMLVVLAWTALVACNGGDDGEAELSTIPDTTAPETMTLESTTPQTPSTEPSTTPTPTDPPTTPVTAPPTTSVEDLKAQIAADFSKSWELRIALTQNPTLENLDARVAEIAAPGVEFDSLKQFIEELVATGERVVPNDPDLFSVTVEGVELSGSPPYSGAVVTMCYVDNRVRVNAAGESTGEIGELVANRSTDRVALTATGWLPDGEYRFLWTGVGVQTCPPL